MKLQLKIAFGGENCKSIWTSLLESFRSIRITIFSGIFPRVYFHMSVKRLSFNQNSIVNIVLYFTHRAIE